MDKRYAKRVSGAIGKTVVLKQYADKTVITAYPDMSNIRPGAKQEATRSLFAQAVQYAQQVNNDPVQKAAFREKHGSGRSVYHAALSAYLQAIHAHTS